MPSSAKITSKILPLGWITLWICVVALSLGFIFADGTLLTLAPLTFIFFLLTFSYGRLNISKLEVSIDLPRQAHAAKKMEAHTYLDNHKNWWHSYSIQLTIPILKTTKINTFAKWISAKNGASQKDRISIPLRGVTSQLSAKIESSFPLQLISHQRSSTIIHPLIIYPRAIIPIELLSCGSLNDIDPQQGSQFGESLGEIKGVRAWQAGDPVKKIHWQASARSLLRNQGLIVREFDPPGFTPENCSVLFHSHATQGEVFRQDRFERAISLATGTLNYLFSNQVKITLLADFLNWHPYHCESRSQYIESLCLLSHAQRSISTELHELQQTLDSHSEKSDQIIIISDVDPDAWAEGLQLPGNALVIDIRQIKFQRRGFETNSKAS